MLKWNAQRGVVVIPKAQIPAHFKANFEGFWDWSLTEEQKVCNLLSGWFSYFSMSEAGSSAFLHRNPVTGGWGSAVWVSNGMAAAYLCQACFTLQLQLTF